MPAARRWRLAARIAPYEDEVSKGGRGHGADHEVIVIGGREGGGQKPKA